jgi:4-diphosphocytidyl-2-C-methyl-D-erythritol kinase
MFPIDPTLPCCTCVCIVEPPVGLSTPSVFKALEHDKLSTVDPDELLLPACFKGNDQVPDDLFINDTLALIRKA